MLKALRRWIRAATSPGRQATDRQQQWGELQRPIHARYDSAGDSTEFSRYWAASDRLDADSANSRAVRSRLVSRSRYETGSNGYADGMVQTYANFLVGKHGPQLRMKTGNERFNRMVETAWNRWWKKTKGRRKLWTMAHAKMQDGEGLALMRTNPRLADRLQRVALDLVVLETEQCQTPDLPFGEVGYVDGIKFDEWGNPEHYDLLREHPGGQWAHMASQPERVPARFVIHWFKHRRGGQHRAVPECTSVLQVGASSRRWREATVSAAETAAQFSALLKTQLNPEVAFDPVSPMSAIELQRRMLVALPQGWDAEQMRAQHPNAEYSEFNRSQISEQGRPKAIPVNLGAADSSKHNFASGRLDHQQFYLALDVDRDDCDEDVLDEIFMVWFAEAVPAYGWVVPDSPEPMHGWDWPKHPVVDPRIEASSDDVRLRGGVTSLSTLHARNGTNFDEELVQMAEDYGVSVDEMRRILRANIMSAGEQLTRDGDDDDDDESDE